MKKATIRSFLIGSSALFLFGASCENDTAINAKCECPKDKPRFCTYQYVTISVYIKDQNDSPVVLDEYTVKKVRNNQIITHKAKPYEPSPGYYPILTDSQQDLTNTCGEEFELTGSKNGKQVVDTRFTIAHDCCHVTLLKGKNEIKVKI